MTTSARDAVAVADTYDPRRDEPELTWLCRRRSADIFTSAFHAVRRISHPALAHAAVSPTGKGEGDGALAASFWARNRKKSMQIVRSTRMPSFNEFRLLEP